MLSDGRRVGLALSGGGFRATLFGLGGLWRLNELGLLRRLDRVTAVSGGSILAAQLACQWPRLEFVDDIATNFEAVVARPLRRLCARNLDWPAILLGAVTPFRSAGDVLAARYDAHLFKRATLRDFPGEPEVILYATNLQTGRSFRFTRNYVADYFLGVNRHLVVPVARAVAASSAFPPVFSPVKLRAKPEDWEEPAHSGDDLSLLQGAVVLADGGVYDNMGLEALVGNVDVVLVSDGGAPFTVTPSLWSNYVSQLGRVRNILIDQTRALRKRWLLDDFTAGRRAGTYWGIGTTIADYRVGVVAADSPVTRTLASMRTRLHRFSDEEQGRLINWGYALCDAAIRRYVDSTLPAAPRCPIPAHPL
jgi:NTE family protein